MVTELNSYTIPDIKVYPIPKLQGHVIVRMTSLGHGDADPVATTDELGNFELTMTRIPCSLKGGLQTDVFVVAFDPKQRYTSRTPVGFDQVQDSPQDSKALVIGAFQRVLAVEKNRHRH